MEEAWPFLLIFLGDVMMDLDPEGEVEDMRKKEDQKKGGGGKVRSTAHQS